MSDSISPGQFKAAKINGWARTVIVAGVMGLGELVRILQADADTVHVTARAVDRDVAIENQVAALRFELTEKIHQLSEQLGRLETKVDERTERPQPKVKK